MLRSTKRVFLAACVISFLVLSYLTWQKSEIHDSKGRVLVYSADVRRETLARRYLHDWFPNEKFPPFQPEAVEDFPAVNGTPKIPHILHQTDANYMIANHLTPNIKRLVEKHPDWKYYFWTDESARKLIEKHYPQILPTWDKYKLGISKSDALRYIVLFHFGGVYLDVDVDVLRPFDRATTKYTCIITTEPFEHSVLLYDTEVYLSNAVMFSVPKHPFMKAILDKLSETINKTHPLDIAGPSFLTQAYYSYNNISVKDENRTKSDNESNSPYFYKGELPENHEDAVYIPNTQYFIDDIDLKLQRYNFGEKICSAANFPTLSYSSKRACVDMNRRGMIRKNVSKYKFLKHIWDHSWCKSDAERNSLPKEDIRNVVKTCIIYGENSEM